MLIVVIIITIILLFLSIPTIDLDYDFGVVPIGLFLMLIGEIIALIFCICCLVGFRVIDDKIELYTNQNKQIEEKIEVVVKSYMNYESDTLKELKSDSYITLVNLYPELKSDEMIKQQIELYTSNNTKITELKEEKLNKTLYKWWIYFGK